MKTAVIALTKNGCKTALLLHRELEKESEVSVFLKDTAAPISLEKNKNIHVFPQKLKDLIAKIYAEFDAYIMVMATGIVFRTFAPYIEHKTIDPAIVVMDEKAQFCISLLSGHLGGANALAQQVATMMGATPVITTATDVNGLIAFDNVAKANDCAIENIDALPHISGAMVNGETVGLKSDIPIENLRSGDTQTFFLINEHGDNICKNNVIISNSLSDPLGEHTLYLRPRNLVLGVGCRKNTPFEQLNDALLDFLRVKGYSLLSLRAMASIDLKKDEKGLLELAQTYRLPFLTFTNEELKHVGNVTGTSAFVEKVTGTPSVSQAAALTASNGGKTIVEKTIYPGITFSLAEEPFTITIS